jgi:hypothetical protein
VLIRVFVENFESFFPIDTDLLTLMNACCLSTSEDHLAIVYKQTVSVITPFSHQKKLGKHIHNEVTAFDFRIYRTDCGEFSSFWLELKVVCIPNSEIFEIQIKAWSRS